MNDCRPMASEGNFRTRPDDVFATTCAPTKRGVRVSIVGSFTTLSLPGEFSCLLQSGVLCDPRNGLPMEMDAYSAYLALKALEKATGSQYLPERNRLCNALTDRLNHCDGFWRHGAWTGSETEVHMRFTAAAIRLLVEAFEDGLVDSPDIIAETLKRHLAYSERLTRGTWFFHDSLEHASTTLAYPQRRLPNRAFGSSPRNCLALNTHLDTISTVLNVLQRVPLSPTDRDQFTAAAESGLTALELVLREVASPIWRPFSALDSAIRAMVFRSHGARRSSPGQRIKKKMQGLVRKSWFPLRQRIRSRMAGFAFSDGYIERDIALAGTSFEYHLVNVYDLARLLIQLREYPLAGHAALVRQCGMLVDAGLDYAICSSYFDFMTASARQNTRAILLCEAILARLSTRAEETVPPHWVRAYCAIRRLLPPSPAILGYDPFTVIEAGMHETHDIVRLRSGRLILIDIAGEDFSFAVDALPATTSARLSPA
jgi:hypothetical protein